MKLTRTLRLILALAVAGTGWLMIGLSYSTPLGGHLTNTALLILGLGMGLSGVVWFIWTVSRRAFTST